MSSWSKRRKSLYALVVLVLAIVVIGIPVFYFFYKAPTCTDGIRNGNEQGVDCGGSCQKLCQTSFLAPSLAWTRIEQIAPGLYNIAAYIVNPNIDAEALNVPYHVSLYDDRGVLITDAYGTVTLPPHRNTLAFQGAIDVDKPSVVKALFEFTSPPDWYKKKDGLSAIAVGEKKYLEDELGSSLTVVMKNTSVYPLSDIGVYAILYDKDGNALGFSKTLLDEIPAQGSSLAPFTWPVNRKGAVISIEILPVAE